MSMDAPDIPPDPRLWRQPEFKKGRHFTMGDFAEIIAGNVCLPNPKPQEPMAFLSDLAARGHMMEPVWGYSISPENLTHRRWTQFFMLGHIYSGTGYAVIYGGGVQHFALCEHEKVRGDSIGSYHPAHCGKCGMDMSVDSGD